ncbi:MAG: D-lyxose/D-mannose family sugar isomerase [Eubacteriales bacterium]
MLRSEIESAVCRAKELLEKQMFRLPPIGYWTMEDFKRQKDLGVIKKTMLGWDVTDFGQGDFKKVGCVLFTLRNGTQDKVGTPYAEKLIVLAEGQRLPLHFHYKKTEDIINRGGGVIYIQLYNSLSDGSVDYEKDVFVWMDGIGCSVHAGEEHLITPGSSITLTPGMYHLFGAKEGYGDVLCGEVSAINDDKIDNRFAEDVSRFTLITEDIARRTLLCNEYVELPD